MTRWMDVFLTALAPAIWGSTYLVTTEFLPTDHPITLAMLRALPAGLVLLVFVRQLPKAGWWGRVFLLGGLNFSVFWILLFIAAYRLPGGVAATVGAVQPLIVIFLARLILDSPIRFYSVIAATAGILGVGLLVSASRSGLDVLGIAAALGGAVSMAAGTVLSRHWRPDVPLLAFTSWQLIAGGVLLLPFAIVLEPPLGELSQANLIGLIYLSLIGAAGTYILWFRGLSRIEPSAIAALGFLSPLTAVALGWLVLNQTLNIGQIIGALIVLVSLLLSQWAVRRVTSS